MDNPASEPAIVLSSWELHIDRITTEKNEKKKRSRICRIRETGISINLRIGRNLFLPKFPQKTPKPMMRSSKTSKKKSNSASFFSHNQIFLRDK